MIRRRIPHRFAYVLQTFFAALIIAFFLYVTYWDANRAVRPWLKKNKPAEETQPAASEPAPPPAAAQPRP